MAVRRVTRSADFDARANALYPLERSTTGRPSFSDFEKGPLASAERVLSVDFDGQQEQIEGFNSIRYVTILAAAFQPLVFSAWLLPDDTVELVGLVEDHDYWDLIENDPID